MTSMYRSQWEQDKFLNDNLFRNAKNGFFVEVGAYDGISGSNTYFYEKELQWNGICIEPITDQYEKLLKNRNCICLNCCIAEKNKTVNFRQNTGYTEMLSGIQDNLHPKHQERIISEQERYGGTSCILQKEAFSLTDILERYNVTKVDYLSLDTEGNEFDIVKGIDFEKIFIGAISVENNYNDNEHVSLHNFLLDKNFCLVATLGGDKIYINLRHIKITE